MIMDKMLVKKEQDFEVNEGFQEKSFLICSYHGKENILNDIFFTIDESLKITKVTYVHDGDNCYANLNSLQDIFCKEIPIRIAQDTPEIKGNCPSEINGVKKAKSYLSNLLKKQKSSN